MGLVGKPALPWPGFVLGYRTHDDLNTIPLQKSAHITHRRSIQLLEGQCTNISRYNSIRSRDPW